MNRLHPHIHLANNQRRINRQVGAIEWEELPSLADSLAQRMVSSGARHHADFENSSAFQTAWNPTLPAALDPLVESGPFTESLHGLVTRELRDSDVFRHFFA
jgi:hypothetical protein